MRAGALRHIITIEREAEAIAPSGAVSKTWTPVATVRAERVQQNTAEFLAVFGEAEKAAAIWRIRFLPGLTTADRVTHGGMTYDLKEVAEIGRQQGMELRGVRVQ